MLFPEDYREASRFPNAASQTVAREASERKQIPSAAMIG
jgi:hypothetical protein